MEQGLAVLLANSSLQARRTGAAGFDPRFDQVSIRGGRSISKGITWMACDRRRAFMPRLVQKRICWSAWTSLKVPCGFSMDKVRGTSGGLINRVSKRPSKEPVRELMLTGASHDRKQLALDIDDDMNESGTAQFRITGLLRRGEHEREIADDRDVLASAFDFQLSEKTTLRLRGQYIKDETDSGVGTYVDNGRPTSLRISDPDYDCQKQTEYQMGYELGHRYSDALTLSQHVRYGDLDMSVRYLDNAGVRPDTRILNLDDPEYGHVSLPTPEYNMVSVK